MPLRRFNWSSDFRTILRSWAALSTGNMGASALSLAAIVVAARTLGPQDYGLLVTVQAVALFVASLFDCNSDVALMKFGAEALEKNDSEAFRRLVKLLLILDLMGAVTALLASWAVILTIGHVFEIPQDMVLPACAYCVVLLTGMRGVPAGLLRTFDRYALVPARDVVGAALRLAFALGLAAVPQGHDRNAFLIAWFVAEATGNLLYFYIGWRELRRRGYRDVFSAPVSLKYAVNSGIAGTVAYTTASAAIRVGSERVDVLFVSALLGPVAVSVLNIAKSFANILIRLCDSVQHAVAPQFARLWARGDVHAFHRLSAQTALVAVGVTGAILAALWVGATTIIRLIFGAEYVSSADVLVGLTAAFSIMLLGNLYMSVLIAMGRASTVFMISLISAVALFAPLAYLLTKFGVMGVSIAHGVRAIVWASGVYLAASMVVRKRMSGG